MLYDKEKQKGNANRATLAVTILFSTSCRMLQYGATSQLGFVIGRPAGVSKPPVSRLSVPDPVPDWQCFAALQCIPLQQTRT